MDKMNTALTFCGTNLALVLCTLGNAQIWVSSSMVQIGNIALCKNTQTLSIYKISQMLYLMGHRRPEVEGIFTVRLLIAQNWYRGKASLREHNLGGSQSWEGVRARVPPSSFIFCSLRVVLWYLLIYLSLMCAIIWIRFLLEGCFSWVCWISACMKRTFWFLPPIQ